MPLDLTIVIPVKNEETNILICLNSIGKDFAKKIVVVDSYSEDKTPEIATQFGATLIQFRWNGKYPKKRNWYLQNYQPETKWVLFLDADEILTPEFKTELTIGLPKSNLSGYWLNYSIYLENKKLKKGYPLKKLALFNPKMGEYEKIEEDHWSNLDMEIHEHPILEGKLGEIKSKIEHKPDYHSDFWIKKHKSYAAWEAKRFLLLKANLSDRKPLTLQQKIKYFLLNTPFSGILFFLGSYFLYLGILDGSRGYKYAKMKFWYFNEVYKQLKKTKN